MPTASCFFIKAGFARTVRLPRFWRPGQSKIFSRSASNCTVALPASHGWCMANKQILKLVLCAAAMVVAAVIAVTVGSRHLDLVRALQGGSPDREILVELRLPRAVLALLTGGALALGGVL